MGEGGTWHLGPLTPGVSQNVVVHTGNGTSIFRAAVTGGSATSASHNIMSGASVNTTLNFIPNTTFVDIEIADNSSFGGTNSIQVFGFTVDTVTYTPQTVVATITSGDDYHYGFNGQMKTNEMAGVGNWTTALWWEYDTRTGTRKNRDPRGSAWESSYSTFGRNPIWFSDPFGDTLKLPTDPNTLPNSIKDIQSLVDAKNQQYLQINGNNVSVQGANAAILASDGGLALINSLSTSSKNILYEASDYALGNDEQGNKIAGTVGPNDGNGHGIINASNGGKDSKGKHENRPKDGFDGQVVINPGMQQTEQDASGAVVPKSRASIVFHELAENYERTNNNVNYNGAHGAHQRAINRENNSNFRFKSYDPGVIAAPPTIPVITRVRAGQIGIIVQTYMFSK